MLRTAKAKYGREKQWYSTATSGQAKAQQRCERRWQSWDQIRYAKAEQRFAWARRSVERRWNGSELIGNGKDSTSIGVEMNRAAKAKHGTAKKSYGNDVRSEGAAKRSPA